MNNPLLPPNATALEHAASQSAARISDLPAPPRHVRNPATCPAELLPFLAWELSVDEWNPGWGEDVKRTVLAASVNVHRHKGTLGAVRRALAAIFGDTEFTIIEGADAGTYDGTKHYNGLHYHSGGAYWAMYSVLIAKPITISQAASVRRILAWVAPARCHLAALSFEQALNAYDGAIRYDNSYTHGVA
jgi:phage tail P2-like protein